MTVTLICVGVYLLGIGLVLALCEGSGPEGKVTDLDILTLAVWPLYLSVWLVLLTFRFAAWVSELALGDPRR